MNNHVNCAKWDCIRVIEKIKVANAIWLILILFSNERNWNCHPKIALEMLPF